MIDLLDERLNYRDPAYWDGHGTEDSCPWTESFKYPFLLFDAKAARSANLVLSSFFDHSLRFPVRRFDPGQIFDASKFELGTIVRFTKELLVHNPRTPGEIYIHWGVVADHYHSGLQERSLVHVVYSPLETTGIVLGVNPTLHYLTYSPLTVGEVYHEKVRYEGPNGEIATHEYLSRITRLEIMRAADEGTKDVTQSAARFLLNPALRPS